MPVAEETSGTRVDSRVRRIMREEYEKGREQLAQEVEAATAKLQKGTTRGPLKILPLAGLVLAVVSFGGGIIWNEGRAGERLDNIGKSLDQLVLEVARIRSAQVERGKEAATLATKLEHATEDLKKAEGRIKTLEDKMAYRFKAEAGYEARIAALERR